MRREKLNQWIGRQAVAARPRSTRQRASTIRRSCHLTLQLRQRLRKSPSNSPSRRRADLQLAAMCASSHPTRICRNRQRSRQRSGKNSRAGPCATRRRCCSASASSSLSSSALRSLAIARTRPTSRTTSASIRNSRCRSAHRSSMHRKATCRNSARLSRPRRRRLKRNSAVSSVSRAALKGAVRPCRTAPMVNRVSRSSSTR